VRPVDYDLSAGLACFYHQTLLNSEVISKDVFGGYGDEKYVNLQIARFENLSVCNLHGIWIKDAGKTDTPRRLKQAKKISNLVAQEKIGGQDVILSGDFNLRPDTESMEIIESVGLRNLVTEFGVTDTRTSFYDKDERFADYILVSDGITVNDFQVLSDEVSDHAPLLLDFEM
jgi:endonuclease/exonuclease/phosphatase family metal-dependent hydrolase